MVHPDPAAAPEEMHAKDRPEEIAFAATLVGDLDTDTRPYGPAILDDHGVGFTRFEQSARRIDYGDGR